VAARQHFLPEASRSQPETHVKRPHFLAHATRLAGLTLASSALGLARELLIARQLGANHATDAYLVAVSVPVLMYALFFGSGLNVSLVPRLTVMIENDRQVGHKVFAQFLSGAALISFAGSCILLVAPATLIGMFAPGLLHSEAATSFLRALSPLVFLFVVTYALGSFHCASGQMAQWGVIPVIQNAALVLGLIVAGKVWGIGALLAGTLAGAVLALLVQARSAHGNGLVEPWANPFRAGMGRSILIGMLPFALVGGMGGDFGTSQVDIFLIRFFASSLAPGSITLLTLGNKLMGLPVLLIGAALGLALLPTLSAALERQDFAAAGHQLCQAWFYAFLLISPIAIIYLDLNALIVQLVFGKTALSQAQMTELGHILRAYAGALLGLVLVYPLNSFLAAQRRTRALIGAGILIIAVDVIFMLWFRNRFGAPGIALAISAGSLLYCAVLSGLLVKHLPRNIRRTMVENTLIVGAGALAMHCALPLLVRAAASRELTGLGLISLASLVGAAIYVTPIAACRARLHKTMIAPAVVEF
jgi:putative peptidoglycan lipid II flippase